MATLRPDGLAVQRVRSGQAGAGAFREAHGLGLARMAMLAPAGQVSRPAGKSMLNWPLANRPPALRTRQALQ